MYLLPSTTWGHNVYTCTFPVGDRMAIFRVLFLQCEGSSKAKAASSSSILRRNQQEIRGN